MSTDSPWRPARWQVAALALGTCAALGVGGWHLASAGPGPEPAWETTIPVDPSSGTLPPIEPAAPAPISAAPEVAEAAPAPPAEMVVRVEGAVAQPGVYRLPADARVGDALAVVGGILDVGDGDDLNWAAPLRDGTTLTVPERAVWNRDDGAVVLRNRPSAAQLNPPEYTRSGWRPVSAPPPGVETATTSGESGKSRSDGKINVNTANQAALETLPGIGPTFAGRIVAERAQEPFTGLEDLRRVGGIGPKRIEALRDLVVFE